MQRGKNTNKIRLKRADDGSVAVPEENNEGELREIWDANQKHKDTIYDSSSANLKLVNLSTIFKKNNKKPKPETSVDSDDPVLPPRATVNHDVIRPSASNDPDADGKVPKLKLDRLILDREQEKKSDPLKRQKKNKLWPPIMYAGKVLSRRINQLGSRRMAVSAVSGAIILVVAGLIINNSMSDSSRGTPSQIPGGTAAGGISTKVSPEYAVLSPGGQGVESLGGYARISQDGKPAVYAYVDSINGIRIRVSQQQQTDSMLADATKVKEIAEQFNAREELEIGDFKAYIGKSMNGPQSVVYSKGTLLVLISSDSEITNKDWVKYIGSLEY